MSGWNLGQLLADLHEHVEAGLTRSRRSLGHPVAKGDASEAVWLEMLQGYLPHRYRADP